MPTYLFTCPHCSSPLRLRDRRLIGRTIDCPDCRQSVLLREAGGTGDVYGERVFASRQAETEKFDPDRLWKRLRESRWVTRVTSPLAVAWVVAGILVAGLAALLLSTPASVPIQVKRSQNEQTPAAIDGNSAEDLDRNPEAVRSQFDWLYDRLADNRMRTGTWPQGSFGDASVPREGHFSWLAVLASEAAPHGPQPQWNRAWNDPLNDPFVRQRIDAFLNPAIGVPSGSDRYPASHFVGVTGYGEDANALPEGHPRSGIFGRERALSDEDIPDGLANTMLVAGVQNHLGSWAAAGHSTLRGFTSEPYVNGPDGFGTGQTDGMYVVMADGSVRFLSSNIDPEIVRKLVARADGRPESDGTRSVQTRPESIRREKSDGNDAVDVPHHADNEVPRDEQIRQIVAELAGNEQPIEVPLAGGPFVEAVAEPVDLDAALRQPIVRFDQSTPIPVKSLLRSVEEMAGVTINTEGVAATFPDRLERPITVTLEKTTVGEILAVVLSQVALDYELHGDHVRVLGAKPAE